MVAAVHHELHEGAIWVFFVVEGERVRAVPAGGQEHAAQRRLGLLLFLPIIVQQGHVHVENPFEGAVHVRVVE